MTRLDLQGRLSDYNIASQMSTASDIIAIQKQTTELESSNNQMSTELETIFAERQHKENQLKQLTEQINKVFILHIFCCITCFFIILIIKNNVGANCNGCTDK